MRSETIIPQIPALHSPIISRSCGEIKRDARGKLAKNRTLCIKKSVDKYVICIDRSLNRGTFADKKEKKEAPMMYGTVHSKSGFARSPTRLI